MWMNEYEIEEAVDRFEVTDTPNLGKAARVLSNLRDWTNANSDGWPYWQKPARAATRLMDLLNRARVERWYVDSHDVTAAELAKALTPIKAFLTRQGVDHAEVLK
jgi:hypothetical protein